MSNIQRKTMHVTFNHYGYVTKNIERFEKFWCDILGYKLLRESKVNPDLCEVLFGFRSGGTIRRYENPKLGPDVEIHVFDNTEVEQYKFNRFGINHICLETGYPGSRKEFVDKLPRDITVKIFNNPKGWKNYFIQDYDGNWIELREDIRS